MLLANTAKVPGPGVITNTKAIVNNAANSETLIMSI